MLIFSKIEIYRIYAKILFFMTLLMAATCL